MYAKPDRRVNVIFRNVHDGKSRCVTILDTDCHELHTRFCDVMNIPAEQRKPNRRRRKAS